MIYKKFLHSKFTQLITATIIFIFAILFWSILQSNSTDYLLVIEDVSTQKIIFQAPVLPQDSFSLTYSNSLYDSRQEETFIIQEDGSILLEKVSFHSYLAFLYYVSMGLEELPLEKYETTQKDEKWIVNNLNVRMESINHRVGYTTGYQFSFKSKQIQLEDWIKPGKPVRIYMTLIGGGVKG